MQKLKLTPKQIRELQEKHQIKNLLNPGDDAPKMATVDFLTDITFEGSRKWESPPSKEQVEEFDVGEMLTATKDFFGGDSSGNA